MKPHLLLVHSFPTNSVLLRGLKEFLDDYFIVHFIDLPGFHKDVPPFNGSITFKKFSNYFEQKILELDLKEYVVAGVSFGFLVVNSAKLDKRCKAILAMEPFINTDCLNISFLDKGKYKTITSLLKIVRLVGIESKIWESDWFNKYLQNISNYPEDRVNTIIRHIDPRTFFTVMNLLLGYKKIPNFTTSHIF